MILNKFKKSKMKKIVLAVLVLVSVMQVSNIVVDGERIMLATQIGGSLISGIEINTFCRWQSHIRRQPGLVRTFQFGHAGTQ